MHLFVHNKSIELSNERGVGHSIECGIDRSVEHNNAHICDSDLKDMTTSALGLKEFDPEPVFVTLDHISVRPGAVTLHYKDGAMQTFPCVHRRRIVTHTENLRKPKAKKHKPNSGRTAVTRKG